MRYDRGMEAKGVGTQSLESMVEARRTLLTAIKRRGASSIASLAEHLGISYEGTRQHLGQLELEGWVRRRSERDAASLGRPRQLYTLTTAGDHLFPKEYDELAVTLIDAAGEHLGDEAVRTLLAGVADKKVRQLLPRVEGRSLAARLEVVKDLYRREDPFTSVELDEDGGARLIERNCPYLEVARQRPALCSVTVSVLRRLLGRKVTRVERFQNGLQRCVFEVSSEPDDENAAGFEWEPEMPV